MRLSGGVTMLVGMRSLPSRVTASGAAGEVLRPVVRRISACWHGLSLSSKFAVTATLVVMVGMVSLGFWVHDRIKTGVIRNSAANAALYLVGAVEPHVQSLTTSDRLSDEAVAQLDQVFRKLSERRFVTIKVWAPGGRLAYASDKRLIGEVFPESPKLKSAWLGNVEPEYDDLSHAENAVERRLGVPILEVYAPVRALGGTDVVAVAEIYEVATGLALELRQSFLQTLLAMAGISGLMLCSLLQIVHQGSRTIDHQQTALAERVEAMSAMLRANTDLQGRLADANRRAGVANEQYLRRIGADLHDGPAQLIGYGLLRLDALRPRLRPSSATAAAGSGDDIDAIEGALRDGLRELRAICADIAIPELRDVDLHQALRIAVRNHEHRTNTEVALDLARLPCVELETPLIICLYRFVQEGLNNAFRHAGGSGQRVAGEVKDGVLEMTVSDDGPGMNTAPPLACAARIGLAGLKERVLAAGGSFEVHSKPGQGTRLTVRFQVENNNPSSRESTHA